MARLGLRAYRFSIAWPRIQPAGHGPPLASGLHFYRRLINEVLHAGIQPVAGPYHSDLPQELEDRDGWPVRDTARRVAEYAEIVFGALQDRVTSWATINDPWCPAFLGHASGVHVPRVRDLARAIRAADHLLLRHGLALRAMRAIDPRPRQKITLNLIRTTPPGPRSAKLDDAARRIGGLQNPLFLDPALRGAYPDDVIDDLASFGRLSIEVDDLATIAEPLDWLGVNFYVDRSIELAPAADAVPALSNIFPGVIGVRETTAGHAVTDSGWPVTPGGLCDLLIALRRLYPSLPPLWMTENGAAYNDKPKADGSVDDWRRIAFRADHISSGSEAMAAGVEIAAYFIWSFLDDFEGSEGYSNRFGLIQGEFARLSAGHTVKARPGIGT